MAEFNLKLTQGGAVLLAKALSQQQLKFKYISLGSGVGSGNAEDATGFVNKVIDLPLTKCTRLDTSAIIEAVLQYNTVPQGFTWTELGVIAIDPDTQEEILYMYDYVDIGEVVPPAGTATQIEKQIRIATYVSNAANVTAVIDESLIYIQKSDIGKPNGVAPLNKDEVVEIEYGGTGAKTKKQACDNLDAMSAVCAYYTGDDADGILDTTLEPTVIIAVSSTINAELYNLIGGNWAYVYQSFFTSRSPEQRRVQLAIGTSLGKIACRHYDSSLQKWNDWTAQATTKKPTIYALALADNFSPRGINEYFKTEDGVVTVSFNIMHNTSFVANNWVPVATLPVGFRPKQLIYLPAMVSKTDNTYASAQAAISSNGEIKINTASADALNNITVSCSFVAEN